MPKLKINGIDVDAKPGMNLVEAAKLVGVEVPVFCYHPKLSIAAQCRMCLVEIEKQPKLAPACQVQAAEGMVVWTNNPRVKAAQASVMELLLLNHPVDCPICDQAGECKLQDYYMVYDLTGSRSTVRKVDKPKAQDIGGGVVLDSERCVVCTRCVRYFEEIVGEPQMAVFHRGEHVEVSIFPDSPLHGNYCGNAVDLCPVGALTWRDFRFQCRSWFLTKTPSVCPGCARGCNVTVDHHEGKVFRLKPRENSEVNQCWMCDEGRQSFKFVNEGRVLEPRVRGGAGVATATWDAALHAAAERLENRGDTLGVVVSPQSTLEDNQEVVRFAADYLGTTRFYLGGKPDGEGDAFLRVVDKNPNRAGVRLALGARADSLRDAAALLDDLESGRLAAVLFVGHELPVAWSDVARFADAFRRVGTVVALASNASPLVDAAAVVLPVATFAEKGGTFVNVDGKRQAITPAFTARGLALPEETVVAKLAHRMGFEYRRHDAGNPAARPTSGGVA